MVKVTKSVNPDKYGYSGYGIWFYVRSQFLLPGGSWSKIVVTFGADMSSSVHIDNGNKDINEKADAKKRICVRSAL